ncbi:unnamed protein product [Cunninghamella echinulata]
MTDLSLTETTTDAPIVYQSWKTLDSASSSATTLQNESLNEKASPSTTTPPSASPLVPLPSPSPTSSSLSSSSSSSPSTSSPSSPTLKKSDKGLINISETSVDKRGNPSACIFVASLNKEKTDEQLNITVYKHFEKWGNLVNVKVFKDWKSRPYAFVQYQRVCDAKVALEEAHGTILDNRAIRCESARVNRTLCVTSIQQPLNKDDVYEELQIFGPIEEICIENNNMVPVAYVRYHYRDDAIRAYLTLQTSIYKSQWVVEWTANINSEQSQEIRYDKTCVYVGNIDKSIKKEDIKHRFKIYGEIVNITLIQKKDHKVTFGFIKYANEKEAKTAVDSQNGQSWYGHILAVAFREIRPFHTKYNNNNNNNNNNITANTTNITNTNVETPSTTKVVWTTKDGLHSYQQNRPHPPGLSIPAANFYPYHIPITVYPSTTLAPSPIIHHHLHNNNNNNNNNKQVTYKDNSNNNNDHYSDSAAANDQSSFSPAITYPGSINNTAYYSSTPPMYASTPIHTSSPYFKASPMKYNTYYLSNGNNNNLYHYGFYDSPMNAGHNILPESSPSNMITCPSIYYYYYYPNHLNQEYSPPTPLYNSSSYFQMYPHADTQQYMLASPITNTPNSSIPEETSLENDNQKKKKSNYS